MLSVCRPPLLRALGYGRFYYGQLIMDDDHAGR
jgi:hypothetical protein